MRLSIISTRVAGFAVAAVSLLAACGGSSSDSKKPTTPVASMDARSKLALGPCAVPFADPSAVCRTLTVAEDRADQASRLIGLPFAIFPAVLAKPATDPIVVFTGGPGPSPLRTFTDLPAEALQGNPLRQKRDVIVMTQRGTDLTTPQSLDCNELALDAASAAGFASEDAALAAATACRDRLVRAGVKLAQYTTKAIARDMEDLRVLLGAQRGFKQWNLVGSSFGSRLALAVMRDAPQGVRSAVLDGPFPLQSRELYGAGVLDALTQVLAACNASTDCAAAYPNLQSRFAQALEKLQTSPAVVGGKRITGHALLNVLRGALSTPRAPYGSVPLFMERIAQADYAGADAVLPFLAGLVIAINPEGMFYTVTCTDDAGQPRGEALPAEGAGWPDAVRRLIAVNGLGLQARTCGLWTQGQTLSRAVSQPLRSSIPALITVGQFDASTPVTDADRLLADLSRARKVVLTGRGHGLLESDVCMLQISAAFLDDPLKAPDTSCVDAASSLRFVTPSSVQEQQAALQEKLSRQLREQPLIPSMQVRVEVPQGDLAWSGAGGVVERNGGAAVGADTVFRIASVTKMFTAATIYRLVEQGRLQPSDAIAKHLSPDTTALLRERGYAPDQITVEHLLAHTSGLPDHDSPQYQRAVLADPTRKWTRREQIAFGLERFQRVGAPGAQYSYADTGYIILGEIIEMKTGGSLAAAYRSLLNFEALEMKSTWMEATEPAPRLASGFAHNYTDTGIDTRRIDPSTDTYGGGGLVSSVADLTRFVRGLFEGRVVSAVSLAAMTTEFQPGSTAEVGLGRGLFRVLAGEQRCWGHPGFFGAATLYCPTTRSSVALSLNLALSEEKNLGNKALDPTAVAASFLEAFAP